MRQLPLGLLEVCGRATETAMMASSAAMGRNTVGVRKQAKRRDTDHDEDW